jgi:integrase
MQREGYRNSTIQSTVRALKSVARHVNLLSPESAKAYLAQAELSEGRKEVLAQDLARFYKYKGIEYKKPRYQRIERLPFIPLENEIDQLISAVGYKTAAFLQLLKETGMRPGEAWNFRWKDIDTERLTVTIAPEKNSRPRMLRITSRLLAMLTSLPHDKLHEFIFRNPKVDALRSLEDFRRHYEDNRRNAAKKTQNPRLIQISFHTLRHWKATTEYHKTKDILHVMQLLGHKNIKNTLVYTHLVNWESDDYTCKVAQTVDEAKALIESGFDFVTDVEGYKLFRKRK